MFVLDSEELEKKESSTDCHYRTVSIQEIPPVLDDDNKFSFPIAEGLLSQPGVGDREMKIAERRAAKSSREKKKWVQTEKTERGRRTETICRRRTSDVRNRLLDCDGRPDNKAPQSSKTNSVHAQN